MMDTKKQYMAAVGIALCALFTTNVYSQCWIDSPDCGLFWDTGAWNPSGDLLDVALQTLNTVESCVDNGGKPFYQMQMGISDRDLAQLYAPALIILKRSAWCTETVAYWHLEAQRPYSGGYSTWWRPSWQLRNTAQIRLWYLMETAFQGRGRWIDAKALDLNNFQPGYNAPCPGAYQQIMGYIPQLDMWLGSGNAHSQVVDWMTVRHRPDGSVISFDLGLIEGNSDNRVRNDHIYLDAPRYTPQGGAAPEDFINVAKLRKIRGWGVDLNANGEPLCAWDRITWIEVPPDIPAPFPDFAPVDTTMDKADQIALKQNMDFAEALADDGGPMVSFGNGPEIATELPSPRVPWVVEEDLFEVDLASVYIKYPKPFPDPVGMVEVSFTGPNIPEKVTVEAKEYGRKDLPGHPRGKVRNREASMELSEGMRAALFPFEKGIVAKKFRIELKRRAKESGGPIKINSLNFHAYLDPKDEDSDVNE